MTIPAKDRIYVNRSINMASIKAIGFDMDHTLAVYNHLNFEALAFKSCINKCVEHGYPSELKTLEFDPKWVIRGLLVDHDLGNILKIDRHNYVKYAYHGKRALTKEERTEFYNSKKMSPDAFLSLDTLFSLSEVHLFIEMVDFKDRHPDKLKKSYKEISQDIRKFIDLSHADGSIKNEVIQHPQDFLIKDKHLAETLKRLREGGKYLFILTNSDLEYTDKIMSFLMNEYEGDHLTKHWTAYFDSVFVSARKPLFFASEEKAFSEKPQVAGGLRSSSDTESVDRTDFVHDKIYSGGTVEDLHDRIGHSGGEIFYVGDHIYGDIITSKGKVNWRTLLVVEELENEVNTIDETSSTFEKILQLYEEREKMDEQTQILRSKISFLREHLDREKEHRNKSKVSILEKDLQKNLAKLQESATDLNHIEEKIRTLSGQRDRQFHSIWGELMKVGPENSRFARQVMTYACLYTSRVSNLRYYSPFRTYVSTYEKLPHES